MNFATPSEREFVILGLKQALADGRIGQRQRWTRDTATGTIVPHCTVAHVEALLQQFRALTFASTLRSSDAAPVVRCNDGSGPEAAVNYIIENWGVE